MKEDEIIQKVWELFKKTVKDTRYHLYLFGSRAEKKSGLYSDFDFGIVGHQPVDADQMNQLKSEIDALTTLYSIDIVDFQKTSSEFREIAQKGMVEILDGKIRSK